MSTGKIKHIEDHLQEEDEEEEEGEEEGASPITDPVLIYNLVSALIVLCPSGLTLQKNKRALTKKERFEASVAPAKARLHKVVDDFKTALGQGIEPSLFICYLISNFSIESAAPQSSETDPAPSDPVNQGQRLLDLTLTHFSHLCARPY